MNPPLTAERLRELLDYDPATGVFTWRKNLCNSVGAGDLAGTTHRTGYRVIQVAKRLYLAHRLAWLYMHGHWPKSLLDHINRVKTDNRIVNLREVSQSENRQNCLKLRSNTSGYKGVTKSQVKGRWQAQITVNGRGKYLGLFDTPELAHEAYVKAAAILHTHNAEVRK